MRIAMMADDFEFFDQDFVRILHSQLHSRHAREEVLWLEIR